MKASEKVIVAILTMVVGVLLIAVKDRFIGLIMTVAGVTLIVLGVMDIFKATVPPAIVKTIVGVLIILCGWTVVQAILYVVSAILLIFAVLTIYYKVKNRGCSTSLFFTVCEYLLPCILFVIGIIFLFHQSMAVNAVFILAGILTIFEGALLLTETFSKN